MVQEDNAGLNESDIRCSDNCRAGEVVQLGEVLLQVGVAFGGNLTLVWLLSVAGVDLLDDVHPVHNFAEWSESLTI